MNVFQNRNPWINDNVYLRIPQIEAYKKIQENYESNPDRREKGIILPVGCGKSGLITLVPFALKSKRTLVVAPNVKIANQLYKDFDPTKTSMFYIKCRVLDGQPYPEPVEIRGTSANRTDLEEAEVIITNIQQLQGEENRWLNSLPNDFFDLILFDEAHHNVANSWIVLRETFPMARIVNFSATPRRSDGLTMTGEIIYSFPIFRAIEEGYVKRLKAIVLNPRTLKYVREEDGQEIEVTLDKVKELGEQDAQFRRSIVTSKETLNTIVDASIRELDRIRAETGDSKHKIIAAALNYHHCIQVVEAYRARGRNAEYVHSNEDGKINDKVLKRLEEHEIDVIVQVRKLGEGFDHPYLSVAAVFTVFKELSPFVQFVGRIMRVIDQNAPESLKNQGTVVFHAGSNIASLWEDFQEFSQADQEFFNQLLPIEELDFGDAEELIIEPRSRIRTPNNIEIRKQEDISVVEIPLVMEEESVREAFELLRSKGVTPDAYKFVYEHQPVPTTKVRERQAARYSLDDTVKTKVGEALKTNDINPQGRELDKKRLGKTNYVVLKSAIDKSINKLVDRKSGERSDFSKAELDLINNNLDSIVAESVREAIE